MASRMEKYYNDVDDNVASSRSQKNASLYKQINDSEINDFDRNSNATVLTDVKNEIDVEKIKKILDTRYNEAPKRKSIRIEVDEDEETSPVDFTKEYDINAILEKAKEEKNIDLNYEQDRLKKLKDTQFNILNNLDLAKNESEVESEEEKTLINLINTITEREMLNREKELDPLDILSGLTDDVDDEDKTLPSDELGVIDAEDAPEEVEEDLEEIKEPDELADTIDDSFYTKSNKFTESDFDDFNDLKAEVSSHKILLKVVISLLVIGVIIGTIIILNLTLHWDLF